MHLLERCSSCKNLKVFSNGEYENKEWQLIVSRLCHASLGVFGSSKKAQAVTPNKLVESIAMRIPVITSGSRGANDNYYSKYLHLVNTDEKFIINDEIINKINIIQKKLSNESIIKKFRADHSISQYIKELEQVIYKLK
jgi:hypothetical protein